MTTSWRARLRSYDALAVLAGLWFLVLFLRYVFPPLFDTFRAVYGLSNAQLGTLFTVLMGTYALMQWPGGALSDRHGRVVVITVGVGTALLATAALATWQVVPVLVVAMAVIGFGSGVHKTISIALLARIYPHRTGRVLGVMDATGQLGGVLAPVAVVVVARSARLAWPAIFLAGAAVGVVLLVTLWWRVPRHLDEEPADSDATDDGGPQDGDADGDRRSEEGDPGDPTEEDGEDGLSLRRDVAPLADRRLLVFVLAAAGVSFAWNGVSAFLTLFLIDVYGYSTAAASSVYAGLFVVAVVQPATGAVGDRIGHRETALLLALVSLVGVLGLLSATSLVVVLLAVGALGIGLHGFRPVRDAYVVVQFPAESTGGSLGVVRTIIMAAGALAPGVTGVLTERVGYDAAFGLVAVVLVICGAFIGFTIWAGDRE
jgi:MFS family permease